MKLSRLAVIVFPLIIWLLSQAYFVWPEFFYISLGLSAALTVFFAFFVKTPERNTPWPVTAMLPLSFLVVISVYISLQANGLFIQLLFFALVTFLFNYFKNLYYFWSRPDLYQEENSGIIRAYGSFLVIFFAAADLYGLQSLLSLTVWPMFLMFTAFLLAVSYLNLNLEGIDKKTTWQFSVLATWLLAEMSWVFVFLPLNYNVSALSIGIVYYALINISRLYLQKALTPKKIKLYLIISYVGLAILLFTANWLS
ncbi:MAG: hypothetical protein WCK59_01690 [Candidatus Falkowbacteria bacterium]